MTLITSDVPLTRWGWMLQVTNAVGAEELPAEPEKVLLTGANGFLGRFLLLDFLKRVSTK